MALAFVVPRGEMRIDEKLVECRRLFVRQVSDGGVEELDEVGLFCVGFGPIEEHARGFIHYDESKIVRR